MKTAILEELRALCRDECVKAGGWSQLSRKIGVPRTKLRSLMEGHDPLLRNFVEILEAMDSSLRMIKGRLEEEARRHADSPAKGLSSPLMVRADDGDPEYVRIPQLNTKVERPGTRAPTGGAIAFRRDWLLARNLDVERLAVMQMQGDWMHPTLSDGDGALVDQGVGPPARQPGRRMDPRPADHQATGAGRQALASDQRQPGLRPGGAGLSRAHRRSSRLAEHLALAGAPTGAAARGGAHRMPVH